MLKYKKIKIQKKDMPIILKRYLLLIIPTIILVLVLSNYVANIQIDKVKEIIIGEQKQNTSVINYIISTKIKEIKDDLYIVKDSDEMTRYIDDASDENFSEAQQLIYRIANKKENFCKVRFIDSTGKEVIEILNSDGKTIINEQINMEDQSDSYYYKNTSKLKNGEIYVSEMDLNVEKNEIEIPYRPVIRVSTPIYSEDRYIGILVINYLGLEILEILNENFENSEFPFVEHLLVNSGGYYLYNNDESKTFGFMFEDKEEYNIREEHAELWKQMKLSTADKYEQEDYINYFKNIYPLEKLNGDLDYEWSIVARFNINDLPLMDQFIFLGMKFSDILILLSICILIFISVVIYYYKNKDIEKLNMITMIVENISDATIITDKNLNIVFANKSFEQTTGYSKEEILGKKTNYFKSGLQTSDYYKEMWRKINSSGYWTGEIWDRKKDGMLYPQKISILTMTNSDSDYKYLGIFSAWKKRNYEKNTVNKLKNYSLDTNFPSSKLLSELFKIGKEEKDKKIAVISFSIINYNDLMLRYGETANEKLVRFIDDLQKKFIKDDFIAQLSKNVFLIVLSSIKEVDEIKIYVSELFERVEYINNKTEDIYFKVKAGVSIYPRDGETSEEIINNANLALEYSLSNTDEKYSCYEKIVKENSNREFKIRLLLRDAIEKNELSLNYQPQVNSENHKIVGSEALLRWNSSELGSVSPVEFIPIAENIGIINDLGYWVIEKVFSDFHMFEGKINGEFRVSINISTIQFNDENIISVFKNFSKMYDVNLSRIEIEITENVFVSDVNMVNEKLKKFRELGITIAIDDFGTGFSSLSYLRKLSIDKLKIDRSFIKDYPESDDGIMANVIVDIAKKLNLKVITEGADKTEHIRYLESIGCNLIQGYYYSKPLTLEEFINYLDGSNKKFFQEVKIK